METGMVRWWRRRWLRALAVAVLVVAWTSCGREDSQDSQARANLDFVLQDAEGNDVRLADFRGRPLIINFWATWCGPCKVETPWFRDFVEKYRDQNLAVVGISVDDTPEAIREFAAEYDVNYPLLVGNGHDDLILAYDAAAIIPVSWLIRPDGRVHVKVQGIHPREWFESQVEALF